MEENIVKGRMSRWEQRTKVTSSIKREKRIDGDDQN
jgi:hypothetical protein